LTYLKSDQNNDLGGERDARGGMTWVFSYKLAFFHKKLFKLDITGSIIMPPPP